MHEVMTAFPNLTALRAASPAELGLVALRGVARSEDTVHGQGQTLNWMSRKTLVDDILTGVASAADAPVAAEAVAWILNHGLLAEAYDSATQGWLFTTRLGRDVLASAPTAPAGLAASLRAVDLIPVAMRSSVTPALLTGHFDLAVTAACKAVEVRMRERAALPTSDFGGRLARKFFAAARTSSLGRPDRPGIKDEQHLFEGIFGLYRDRAVHESPHIDSPEYALEVIIAVSHLLRIVDAAEFDP